MYGFPQPEPSLFRAWSMSLLVSAPFAWFAWHLFRWPLSLVLLLWVGLTLASANAVLGRMSDDWRAKLTMQSMRDRYRR